MPGPPRSTSSTLLETGASLVQDFTPLRSICAHLNAFHAYADDPGRAVETNHYCAHPCDEVRQCVLYDAAGRLLGVEYMISARLHAGLDAAERRLWHSHVFEVKSGMLVMPQPGGSVVPRAAWEAAETQEMEQVVELYGKAYHLWQVDRGHTLPLGAPRLMTSYTAEGQMPGFEERMAERDARLGADWRHKRALREHIPEPEIHADADSGWKKQ